MIKNYMQYYLIAGWKYEFGETAENFNSCFIETK